MSLTLEARFLWGRYHGTPWDRSVNEGVVDWPPSPWRIARALYATYRQRCVELDEAIVVSILDVIGRAPIYRLPDWNEAHTRHYFPDTAHGSDKVFDSFVVMERDARLHITWDADLDGEHLGALDVLSENVPYLGRAESLCELRRLPTGAPTGGMVCAPAEPVSANEVVRVLVLAGAVDVGTLEQRSRDIRNARSLVPRGTRWVDYDRPLPSDADVRPVQRHRALPQVVRYAIAEPVRPSRFAALAMTDVMRQGVLGRFGHLYDGSADPLLSGRADDRQPLIGHRHAHYLAFDTDDDGLLDHLAVWVPAGIDERALVALRSLRRLRGYGHLRDFRPCDLAIEAVGPTATAIPELVGPARRWRSFTPFVASRHSRRGSLEERMSALVAEECSWRDLPAPESVRIVRGDALSFRRHRPTRERMHEARAGNLLEVEFATPVAGPISIGRHAHFGLGLFLPIQNA